MAEMFTPVSKDFWKGARAKGENSAGLVTAFIESGEPSVKITGDTRKPNSILQSVREYLKRHPEAKAQVKVTSVNDPETKELVVGLVRIEGDTEAEASTEGEGDPFDIQMPEAANA